MYTKEYLLNNNIAFHCKTEYLAKCLLKILHGYGFEWKNKESLVEKNYWFKHKENTCYIVSNHYNNGLCYGHMMSDSLVNFEIVNFKIHRIKRIKNIIETHFLKNV